MSFLWWIVGTAALVALHFHRKRVKAFHARQDELFQIAESRNPPAQSDRGCEFHCARPRPGMEDRPEIDTELYDIPAFLRKKTHD